MKAAFSEPSRDPNPFHHAAALVEKMDRHDLAALGQLVLERLQSFQAVELTPYNKERRDRTAATCWKHNKHHALTYYADLNPAYPSRGEKRWKVFCRNTYDNKTWRIPGSYTSRKAADSAAERLSKR